jgi:hypothetical protein
MLVHPEGLRHPKTVVISVTQQFLPNVLIMFFPSKVTTTRAIVVSNMIMVLE